MGYEELTLYTTEVTFNSVTYDNDNAGVVRAIIDDSAQEEETRVGADLYPSDVQAVNASSSATIGFTQFLPTLPPKGTKSNLVITVEKKDKTTVAKTMYNMKFMGQSADQSRATAGTNDYRFVFESVDGQKDPFTAPA